MFFYLWVSALQLKHNPDLRENGERRGSKISKERAPQETGEGDIPEAKERETLEEDVKGWEAKWDE